MTGTSDSNHTILINSGYCFHVILFLLLNSMTVHGYTPTVFLKSTIVSIIFILTRQFKSLCTLIFKEVVNNYVNN